MQADDEEKDAGRDKEKEKESLRGQSSRRAERCGAAMSQEMSGIMMAVQQSQPGDEAADERFEADTQLAVQRSQR